MVSATSASLLDAGIAAQDRVAITLSKEWQGVVLMMSLLRIGAVVCPINIHLPQTVLEKSLLSIGCKACICLEGPDLGITSVPVLSAGSLVSLSGRDANRVPARKFTLQQPASILFTSGSCGSPKAVLHSLGNHYYSALGSNRNLSVRSKDRWLFTLPLYHVSGLQIPFRCFLGGAAVAFPSPEESLEESIERYGPTHVSMVPTQLYRYLSKSATQGGETSSTMTILLGGGPAPESLLQEAAGRGLNIRCTYGLTEMTSQVCTTPIGCPVSKRGTAGQALRYREVHISECGEILVRGHTRFQGYVDGDHLEEPFDKDGWLGTGDIGTMDADGYLTVTGRKDNMFISGGENIQPEEIEKAFRSVQGVADAIVVPVDNEEFGQRPVAFVQMLGRCGANDGIRDAVAKSLPRYKIPDHILPWPDDAFAFGIKPDRSALRLIAEKSLG